MTLKSTLNNVLNELLPPRNLIDRFVINDPPTSEYKADHLLIQKALLELYSERMTILRRDKYESNTSLIESALSASNISPIAISAALQRFLRSDLMPTLQRRLKASRSHDQKPQTHKDNVMIDPSQLQRFANPTTYLFVMEASNPGRIAGFRSKNLSKGLPVGGCQLRLQKNPSRLEIYADTPEVLAGALRMDAILKFGRDAEGKIKIGRDMDTLTEVSLSKENAGNVAHCLFDASNLLY